MTTPTPLTVEVWAFRVLSSNGRILADDGNQGYVNKADAVEQASRFGEVTIVQDAL